MSDITEQLRERVLAAAVDKAPLRIRGGGSKDFHAYALAGDVLDLSAHGGVVDYERTELVITARAGTPLAEIERTLAAGGQMLACEPPHFGANATLGGCVASGFSGPRRVQAGSVRDFVLGVKIMNAQGEIASFGGQVMMGRGAVNQKGPEAAFLAALHAFKAANVKLPVNIAHSPVKNLAWAPPSETPGSV